MSLIPIRSRCHKKSLGNPTGGRTGEKPVSPISEIESATTPGPADKTPSEARMKSVEALIEPVVAGVIVLTSS